MDKHERKCQVCGWDKIHPITGEPPLHVHHIDGDATKCGLKEAKDFVNTYCDYVLND